MNHPDFRITDFPAKDIARICGVDEATARRWRRRAICPPKTALILLEMRWRGDLGGMDPLWDGWRLIQGKLVSPEGWEATPGDVRAMQLKEAQVRALRSSYLQARVELEALQAQRLEDSKLEEQPLPGVLQFQLG